MTAAAAAAAVAGQHHPGMLFSQGAGGDEGAAAGGLHLPAVLDQSQPLGGHGMSLQELCLKREQQQFAPAWLTAQQQQQQHLELQTAGSGSVAVFGSARALDPDYIGSSTPESTAQPAGLGFGFSPSSAAATASAHMSATALLQKAAQMGATIGSAGAHYSQMAGPAASAPGGATFGLGLPGLSAQQQPVDGGVMGGLARTASRGRSGEDAGGGGGGADGMTRDFLGLRAFSHRDILDLAGFDSSCMGAVAANANMTCYEPQQHAQAEQQQQQSSNEPWHGAMGSHS